MNNLEILVAAKAKITRPENWMKYSRSDYKGAHCALGAVDAVMGGHSDEEPVIRILASALDPDDRAPKIHDPLMAYGHDPAGWVARFNNTHSHSDVLALFDKAIERQRTFEKMLALEPQETAENAKDSIHS